MNIDAMLEAERRGILPEELKPVLLEAKRRGLAPADEYDPTEGMTEAQKTFAGIGQGMYNLGRGVGQMFGLVSRDDVKEARRLDKALLDTTAGWTGSAIGTGLPLALTAAVPGANTMLGAAGIGLGTGLAMPSESTQETLNNAKWGTLLGPGSLLAGRIANAGYQGTKSLLAPFFGTGQERIAGDTLRAFAAKPKDAAVRVAAAGKSTIPGSRPTAAELAADPGVSQLQRSILNQPEAVALSQQMIDNSTARMNALADIAGDDGKMALFTAARERAANELYEKALNAGIDPKSLTPSLKGEVTKLLKRPSVQEALRKAKSLAAEEGIKLTDNTSLRGLHYAKMDIDDQISKAVKAGADKEARRLISTRDKLLNVIEKLSPDYAEARITFEEMSKPINQMQVGQYLLNKAAPPLYGGGQLGMNKAQFGRAMQQPDSTAKAATKFPGARMEKVMTPEQLAVLKQIEKELAGVANFENLGRAVGSNTTQNLVSQNTLRKILGPLGLSEEWAENTLLQSLMRPVQWSAKLGEPKVVEKVAGALGDPDEFVRLITRAQRSGPVNWIAEYTSPLLPGMGMTWLAVPRATTGSVAPASNDRQGVSR